MRACWLLFSSSDTQRVVDSLLVWNPIRGRCSVSGDGLERGCLQNHHVSEIVNG